jgi:4-amino-4-deoxy-L-arabinose transferase-like glycosyltransferase
MSSTSWSDKLWGPQAKTIYLFIAAIMLLFGMLGGREIWTQEHRWADIVYSMFYYHDFLHPRLDGSDYYDKPLLSYWFIAGISALTGHLSLWAMRLPSALAGLLAIWSIYQLGVNMKDKRLGLLSGWLLLTTFYFVFWARVSSADMLNLAGSLFAVAWYADHRHSTSLFHYTIFFLILSVTALCKGLVGPAVAILAIAPDIILQKSWKKHFNWQMAIALVPATIVYILPFWASSHFGSASVGYQENGLMLVYRENIMRYFQPFDHKGPIYTYLLYLPIYLLPWVFFFIPALFYLKSRWKDATLSLKWISWATLLLFLFFTLSGSRRSYYVLPMVPFGILLTADWILSGRDTLQKRYRWAGKIAICFYIFCVLNFAVLQPFYYSFGGSTSFADTLKAETNKIKPWSEWHFVMLDPASKTRFYLQLPPDLKNNGLPKNASYSAESIRTTWPILQNIPKDTIFITRKYYEPLLRNMLSQYDVIEAKPTLFELLTKKSDPNSPIAFIPKNI